MTGSLNKVMLIGNLGRDPEVRQSTNGNTIANLAIATTERFKDKTGEWSEKTEWHRVVAFGSRADVMAKYLKKGSSVFIEGHLQTRSWDDKDGVKRYSTEVVMRDFQFLDRAGGDSSKGNYNQAPSQATGGFSQEPSSETVIDDDDIPF